MRSKRMWFKRANRYISESKTEPTMIEIHGLTINLLQKRPFQNIKNTWLNKTKKFRKFVFMKRRYWL